MIHGASVDIVMDAGIGLRLPTKMAKMVLFHDINIQLYFWDHL